MSKDPAPTMSYLRHHPNPMMRSRPAEYEWVPADIAKKQQVFTTKIRTNTKRKKIVNNSAIKKSSNMISSLKHSSCVIMYGFISIIFSIRSQLADSMLERALGDDLRSGKKVAAISKLDLF